MSNFTIPKGLDFDFTIKVIEQDSFLPQDLTDMTSATLELVLTEIPDTPTGMVSNLVVTNAVNGYLKGSFTANETATLSYERGDKVDGYYLKPTYFGVVSVKFTAASGIPSITTIIKDIFIVPTGN